MSAVFGFIVAICLSHTVKQVSSHGRLIEPPGRSTAWRQGYSTPINYNDHELYCGGFANQWNVNDGKCGVCGDPYQGPRENEAGGKYAKGVIVRTYQQGQKINVRVELTVSHKGYFQFRICPNNDVTKAVTQECLDKNVLVGPGHTSDETDCTIQWEKGFYSIDLQLPDDLVCTQCVLQWKYNTGNSWGCPLPRNTPLKTCTWVTPSTSTACCVGCGQQEQFFGCADVAITPRSSVNSTSKTTSANLLTTTLAAKETTTPTKVETSTSPASTSIRTTPTSTQTKPDTTSATEVTRTPKKVESSTSQVTTSIKTTPTTTVTTSTPATATSTGTKTDVTSTPNKSSTKNTFTDSTRMPVNPVVYKTVCEKCAIEKTYICDWIC